MNLNKDIDESLLLQYLLGNTDEISRESVEAWLNADRGNQEHLDRLESLWVETGKISPAPVAVDVEDAWLRMSDRITRYEKELKPALPAPKTIRMTPWRYILATAAAIALFVGIYSIYRLMVQAPGMIELASAGMILHDSLPDGTKITLNKNSKLTFPASFKDKNRVIELTGEAFFEVKHDPSHPFIVQTEQAEIRVLGTIFNVKTTPGGVDVAVSEGRVMFYTVDPRTSDTSFVFLEAGDQGSWKQGSKTPVISGTIAPDGRYWADQTFDFRRSSLADVFRTIEKHYQVKITASDPSILDCQLTASFVDEPVDRILTVIAESFGLTLEIQGQHYLFKGNGCSK